MTKTEIYFSYTKTKSSVDFLNELQSHWFSSSTLPRYETVWYYLIRTVPYLILRLLSFFNRFFVPNNMHLALSSPKWILSLLSTNQSQILEKFLLSFVSIALEVLKLSKKLTRVSIIKIIVIWHFFEQVDYILIMTFSLEWCGCWFYSYWKQE